MQGDETPAGVWVSLSDLARQRGVARSSIKERVDRLEADGLVKTRRKGRQRLVELAAFDRAVGSVGDSVKELAAETGKAAREPQSSEYREAQARRANYEAQLKALDLGERMGKLLPIDGPHGVEAAVTAIALRLNRDIDGLALYADDIAAAVSKEGVAGARRILKKAGREIRQRVADSMASLANQGREAEKSGPIETELFASAEEADLEN